LAAVAENGFITICKGGWKIRIDKIVNIPLTFSGRALFMIQNILPAVLAGFVRNFKVEDMRVALETFIPSPIQTPGRMNYFRFRNFEVMVDYAHNTAGMQALGKFLEKVDASPKVGIIAAVGDRRDEDIVSLGETAAKMFDEIVIRQDKNLRGRSADEMIKLLNEGIHSISPGKKVSVFNNEREAIDHVIETATSGSFITICSDVVPDALEQIMDYKEKEDAFSINRSEIPNLDRKDEKPIQAEHGM
jgi:cyanophycin synthetase